MAIILAYDLCPLFMPLHQSYSSRLSLSSLSSFRVTAIQQARPMSSTAWTQFRKDWLSDPGAYPIIAILGLACIGCTAKGTHYLFTHPDARISPSKRSAIVRTWGA
jgi:hypothetical protein